jgi:U3 small nucleolar RNA-associated protein 7
VWDLRKFGCLHGYRLDKPASSVDVSDRGLVAVGLGRCVQVLRGAFSLPPSDVTYLKHEVRTPNPALSSGAGAIAAANALLSNVKVSSVQFCPFEDILCIGHSHGVSTAVVPGAGEPNYDSFESDPFMNPRQRREAEVQSLLTKLSHEMIGLGLC